MKNFVFRTSWIVEFCILTFKDIYYIFNEIVENLFSTKTLNSNFWILWRKFSNFGYIILWRERMLSLRISDFMTWQNSMNAFIKISQLLVHDNSFHKISQLLGHEECIHRFPIFRTRRTLS